MVKDNNNQITISTITTTTLSTNNYNNNNNINDKDKIKIKIKWTKSLNEWFKCSFRLIIGLMGILASILLCSTRYNVSIAIISMVKDLASTTQSNSYCHVNDGSSHFDSIITLSSSTTNNNTQISQKVTWNELQQGFILGAYYYGYATTHIFGGRLSERYGAKWVTVVGLIGAAILNAIFPFSKQFVIFLLLRLFIGCLHGVVEPALFLLFKKWFPPKEQTLALSLLLIGNACGLILNVPISAIIKHINLPDNNTTPDWSLLFFVGSSLHLLWLILWIIFVTNEPDSHPLTNDKEIAYIRQNSHNVLETNTRKVPWLQILNTKALYASIVAKLCWAFNHAIIIDNGPSYLNKIFNFDMLKASEFTAIIYTTTIFVFIFSPFLFTKIIHFFHCKPERLRKIFQSIVFFGASITTFLMAINECNLKQIEILIVINMITQGFTSVGEYPMISEFSGYFSGTVYGIAITFDSLARAITPLIRCELVKKTNLKFNWMITFYITSVLNMIGMIIFTFLASTTPKQWALKHELVRTISSPDDNGGGHIIKSRSVKKTLKLELQNPNYRSDIDTETDDWRQFKTLTMVQ